MKKILAMAVVLLIIVGCFAGCTAGNTPDSSVGTTTTGAAPVADSDLAYIQNKNVLVVGITDFEPMDYQVDGEWTGFDAELARLVAAELGVTVQFTEIQWKMKETELAGKTIDCIWNGLTWDEERAAEMSLTDWYMKNRQTAVARKADADKYQTLEAINAAVVTAEGGSAGEDYIKANLADANYVDKDAQIDALTEVKAQTADVAIIDYVMANYLINKEGSDFADLTMLGDVVKTEDEYYSVAFRKGSDVTTKVNDILKALQQNGKIDELAAKYALTDALVK